jgi:hypothetical protein
VTMVLKINKPTVRRVAVAVKMLCWSGPLVASSVATGFKCSACGQKLGSRMFATAWINDGGSERSMRLCESCGKSAETA